MTKDELLDEAIKAYIKNDCELSVEHFTRLIVLDHELQHQHYYNRARCYVQLKQWQNAIADLDQIHTFDKVENFEHILRQSEVLRAFILLSNPNERSEEGDLNEEVGVKLLDAVIESAPKIQPKQVKKLPDIVRSYSNEARLLRGKWRLLNGKIDEAFYDLYYIGEQCLPNLDAITRYLIGVSYFRAKEFNKADVYLSSVVGEDFVAGKDFACSNLLDVYRLQCQFYEGYYESALINSKALKGYPLKWERQKECNALIIRAKRASIASKSESLDIRKEASLQHAKVIHDFNQYLLSDESKQMLIEMLNPQQLTALMFYLVTAFPHFFNHHSSVCQVSHRALTEGDGDDVDKISKRTSPQRRITEDLVSIFGKWIKLFYDYGGDKQLETTNLRGQTIAHMMARESNINGLLYCLRNFTEITSSMLLTRDDEGHYPLHIAVAREDSDLLWEVLDFLCLYMQRKDNVVIGQYNEKKKIPKQYFRYWCEKFELAHSAAECVAGDILTRLVATGVNIKKQSEVSSKTPLLLLAGSTQKTEPDRIELFKKLVETVSADFILPMGSCEDNPVYLAAKQVAKEHPKNNNDQLAQYIIDVQETRRIYVSILISGMYAHLALTLGERITEYLPCMRNYALYQSKQLELESFIAAWLHDYAKGDWQQITFLHMGFKEGLDYVGKKTAESLLDKVGKSKINAVLFDSKARKESLPEHLQYGMTDYLFELQVGSEQLDAIRKDNDFSSKLRSFKRHFINTFVQSAYCPMMAIASKHVEPDPNVISGTKAAEHILCAIGDNFVSVSPFIVTGVKLANYFFEEYAKNDRINSAKRFYQLFDARPIGNVLLLIKGGADRIMAKYRHQIEELDHSSMVKLVDVMVKRIVFYITKVDELKKEEDKGFFGSISSAINNAARYIDNCFNGRHVASAPSALRSIDAIFLSALYDRRCDIGDKIKLTHLGGGDSWDALAMLRRVGICLPNGELYYALNASVNQNAGDFDKQYGFCYGTREEVDLRGLEFFPYENESPEPIKPVDSIVMLRGGLSYSDVQGSVDKEFKENHHEFVKAFVNYFFHGAYCSLIALNCAKEHQIKAKSDNALTLANTVKEYADFVQADIQIPQANRKVKTKLLITAGLAVFNYFKTNYDQKRVKRFVRVFGSWDVEDVLLTIKRAAELIAYKYYDQIDALNDVVNDVMVLANVAVLRIINYIVKQDENTEESLASNSKEIKRWIENTFMKGQIPPFEKIQKPLYEVFIKGLINHKETYGKKVNITANVLKKPGELELVTWRAAGVFWWTGVITPDGKRHRKDEKIVDGQNSYGYCHGDYCEVEKRKLKYPGLESAIRPIDNAVAPLAVVPIAEPPIRNRQPEGFELLCPPVSFSPIVLTLYGDLQLSEKRREQLPSMKDFKLFYKYHCSNKKIKPLFREDGDVPIKAIYTKLDLVRVESRVRYKDALAKERGVLDCLSDGFSWMKLHLGHVKDEMSKVEEERKELELEKASEVVEPFSINQLFEKTSGKTVNRILIEGSAGMGKTTLAKFIVNQWVAKECLTSFDAVLLIPLRKLFSVFSKGKKFNHEHELWAWSVDWGLNLDVVEEWLDEIKQEKKKILYILDGWDEVAGRINDEFSKWLKILLDEHYYIVLSRPQARYDAFAADQLLRTRGYDYEDIVTYVSGYVKNYSMLEDGRTQEKSVEDLLVCIEQNASVREMAKTPVLLEMLCYLYLNDGLSEQLSGLFTRTKLYERLYRGLKKRFKKFKVAEELFTRRVDNQEAADIIFDVLQGLAYEGMKESINNLSKDVLSTVLESYAFPIEQGKLELCLKELIKTGLVTLQRLGEDESYDTFYFHHLSFQEYLAALFWRKLFHSEARCQAAINLFQARKFDPSYNWVWRFAAGLAHHYNDPVQSVNQFFDLLFAKPRMLIGDYENQLIVECWDEVYELEQQKFHAELQQWLATILLVKLSTRNKFNVESIFRAASRTLIVKYFLYALIHESLLSNIQVGMRYEEIVDLLKINNRYLIEQSCVYLEEPGGLSLFNSLKKHYDGELISPAILMFHHGGVVAQGSFPIFPKFTVLVDGRVQYAERLWVSSSSVRTIDFAAQLVHSGSRHVKIREWLQAKLNSKGLNYYIRFQLASLLLYFKTLTFDEFRQSFNEEKYFCPEYLHSLLRLDSSESGRGWKILKEIFESDDFWLHFCCKINNVRVCLVAVASFVGNRFQSVLDDLIRIGTLSTEQQVFLANTYLNRMKCLLSDGKGCQTFFALLSGEHLRESLFHNAPEIKEFLLKWLLKSENNLDEAKIGYLQLKEKYGGWVTACILLLLKNENFFTLAEEKYLKNFLLFYLLANNSECNGGRVVSPDVRETILEVNQMYVALDSIRPGFIENFMLIRKRLPESLVAGVVQSFLIKLSKECKASYYKDSRSYELSLVVCLIGFCKDLTSFKSLLEKLIGYIDGLPGSLSLIQLSNNNLTCSRIGSRDSLRVGFLDQSTLKRLSVNKIVPFMYEKQINMARSNSNGDIAQEMSLRLAPWSGDGFSGKCVSSKQVSKLIASYNNRGGLRLHSCYSERSNSGLMESFRQLNGMQARNDIGQCYDSSAKYGLFTRTSTKLKPRCLGVDKNKSVFVYDLFAPRGDNCLIFCVLFSSLLNLMCEKKDSVIEKDVMCKRDSFIKKVKKILSADDVNLASVYKHMLHFDGTQVSRYLSPYKKSFERMLDNLKDHILKDGFETLLGDFIDDSADESKILSADDVSKIKCMGEFFNMSVDVFSESNIRIFNFVLNKEPAESTIRLLYMAENEYRILLEPHVLHHLDQLREEFIYNENKDEVDKESEEEAKEENKEEADVDIPPGAVAAQ